MPTTRARRPLVIFLLVGGLVLTGCSSVARDAGARRGATVPARTDDGRLAAPLTTGTGPSSPSATATAGAPAAGWAVISTVRGAVAVDERTVRLPDGDQVTVARFRAGLTRFDLHVGSADLPTGGASLPPDSGPTISPAEAPALLAAFNGGFPPSTGAGGFEVDGTVLAPLVPGDASFVIDSNGSGHVGVWGAGLPAPGEQVTSVRQNLRPLVVNGQPAADVTDVGAWGATLGGSDVVARSALAEDAAGNILYAGSMAAVPADLSQALVICGAVTAMELDINPEWVQLAVASFPGAPLQPGVPGQHRPANQYQRGWTRDFVTVLATAA